MNRKHRMLSPFSKTVRAATGLALLWAAAAAHAETTQDLAGIKLAQASEAPTEGAGTTKTVTTTTTHGGWTVTCSEGGTAPSKICNASFKVTNKKNNAVVLIWLIGRNKEGKVLAEFLTLTDVLIGPGVMLTLEEAKPVKAEYVYCTKKECKSSLDLTPQLIRQMKAAKKAKLDVTLLDGQVVQFDMEVPGIDKALAELEL